jgi:hypothetical protein
MVKFRPVHELWNTAEVESRSKRYGNELPVSFSPILRIQLKSISPNELTLASQCIGRAS